MPRRPDSLFHPTFADRFLARVDRTPGHGPRGDCWLWTGPVMKGGRGQIMVAGVTLYASRVAYFLAKGPIPDGQLVCHECDTTLCLRPSHLWLGDHHANIVDCFTKGRRTRVCAPEQAVRGEQHGGARLTQEAVRFIREHPEYTQAELAKRFGVSQGTILHVQHRHTWAHVA